MRTRCIAIPAAAAGPIVVAFAVSSWAYYQSVVAPSATGTVTPAPVSPMTFDVTGTASADLYPGGAGASVTVSVTNPYGKSITVTGLAASGPVVATPLPGSTCATTGITVSAPSSGLPFTVAANATGTGVTLPAVLTMDSSADSGCQGATFTVPFKITGRR